MCCQVGIKSTTCVVGNQHLGHTVSVKLCLKRVLDCKPTWFQFSNMYYNFLFRQKTCILYHFSRCKTTHYKHNQSPRLQEQNNTKTIAEFFFFFIDFIQEKVDLCLLVKIKITYKPLRWTTFEVFYLWINSKQFPIQILFANQSFTSNNLTYGFGFRVGNSSLFQYET